MNYVVFGHGKIPLIIIPGMGDGLQNIVKSSKPLNFFYRKYAKKYRVFICSRKNDSPTGTTTRNMAEDIAVFMKAQNIVPAYVMGVSMGGMIAQYLSIDYPNYVKKLIIAMSSSRPNPVSNKVLASWIRMAEEKRYNDLAVDVIEKTYTDHYLRKYRPLYFILKRIGKPENTEHFLVQAKACLNHDAYDRLPQIHCSTLVAGSFHDKIVGGEASELISQQVLGSRLLMYSYYGHGAFRESTKFDDDMIAFLDG